jgi:hypothetical protein
MNPFLEDALRGKRVGPRSGMAHSADQYFNHGRFLGETWAQSQLTNAKTLISVVGAVRLERPVKVISYARTFALGLGLKTKNSCIKNSGEVGRFRDEQPQSMCKLTIYNVWTRAIRPF